MGRVIMDSSESLVSSEEGDQLLLPGGSFFRNLGLSTKIALGSALLALLVALVCGFTYTSIDAIHGANIDMSRALDAARTVEHEGRQIEEALVAISGAQGELHRQLGALADTVVGNLPQIALFPDEKHDPVAELLSNESTIFDSRLFPDAELLKSEIITAHEQLIEADQQIRTEWEQRNDPLATELDRLKNTLIYWNLKVANLFFIQSSIGELVYEEIEETPIAEFFASPLADEAGTLIPAFDTIRERLTTQNQILFDTIHNLNMLMLTGEWEKARKLYRDKFPWALKSIAVDLDQMINQVDHAFVAQRDVVTRIEQSIQPTARDIQSHLSQMHEHLVSRRTEITGQIRSSMQAADQKRSLMAGTISYVRSINLLLPWVVLALIIIGTVLFSRAVGGPIRSIASRMEAIAEGGGDLSHRLPVQSRDEIGRLSAGFNRFLETQSRLIAGVAATARRLEGTTGYLNEATRTVGAGARNQEEQLSRCLGGIAEIDNGARQIREHSEGLVDATRQCSSATLELGATIEEIAEQMEHLLSEATAIASASQQMAAASRQVGTNLGQIVARTGDTAQAVDLFDEQTSRIEELAKEGNVQAKSAARDASAGKRAIDESLNGIRSLQETMTAANALITRLGEESRQIDEILQVINEVSDQTNLLALNATIIAAQAGDHGKGFAVVAEEVRDLSIRTAASTREIGRIIEGFHRLTSQAISMVVQGEEKTSRVVRDAQTVNQTFDAILGSTSASEAQAKQIEELLGKQKNQSGRLRVAAGDVHAMLEQIASAVEQLGSGIDHSARISEGVREIASRVTSSTEEQSAGTRHIAENMEGIRTSVDRIHSAITVQTRETGHLRNEIAAVTETAVATNRQSIETDTVVASISADAGALQQGISQFRFEC